MGGDRCLAKPRSAQRLFCRGAATCPATCRCALSRPPACRLPRRGSTTDLQPFTRARPLHGELTKNKRSTKTAHKLAKHKHKRHVCVNATREASDNSACQVHMLCLPFFTHAHTHQGRCLVTLSGALQLVHSSSLSQGKREHSLQNVQTPTSSLQSVSETRKRSTKTTITAWYKLLVCCGTHLQTKQPNGYYLRLIWRAKPNNHS